MLESMYLSHSGSSYRYQCDVALPRFQQVEQGGPRRHDLLDRTSPGPYRKLRLLLLRSLMLERKRRRWSKLVLDHIFSSADVRFGS
ncbi:hypothetical protein NECAME_04574 [Necator americanus]|uniref:Uncharacterized protein n=1 Tax=Necator americanus TaxID=51031 RepID=W2SQE0_NECAM|nr:hypothetical protein NECAME_04574 [Necator americanus]ETN71830.1 hypothetical protein NECAME_04574 [Necator americanus]